MEGADREKEKEKERKKEIKKGRKKEGAERLWMES